MEKSSVSARAPVFVHRSIQQLHFSFNLDLSLEMPNAYSTQVCRCAIISVLAVTQRSKREELGSLIDLPYDAICSMQPFLE